MSPLCFDCTLARFVCLQALGLGEYFEDLRQGYPITDARLSAHLLSPLSQGYAGGLDEAVRFFEPRLARCTFRPWGRVRLTV